jgi:hypothetical protein
LLEILWLPGMKYLLSMAGLEGVEGVAVLLCSMAIVGEAGEDALKPCGQELGPTMPRRELCVRRWPWRAPGGGRRGCVVAGGG